MKRSLLYLAGAIAAILIGGVLIAMAWHLDYPSALYCSIGTASTVGCGDTTVSTFQKLSTLFLIVVAIPLLAASFALLQNLHLHKKIDKTLSMQLEEHHKKVEDLFNPETPGGITDAINKINNGE